MKTAEYEELYKEYGELMSNVERGVGKLAKLAVLLAKDSPAPGKFREDALDLRWKVQGILRNMADNDL